MTIVDSIFIGVLGLFFLILTLYTLGDLFRDLGYYRRKQRNVVKLNQKGKQNKHLPALRKKKGFENEVKPSARRD